MPLRDTELVGRDADLERLRTALGLGDEGQPSTQSGAVRAHRPHRAVLGGNAGIGKSRLVRALTEDASQRGWLVAVGHCVGQAGSTLAYLPFVELIAQARATRPDIVDPVLAAHPSLTRLTAYRAGPAEATGAAEQGLVAESVHALLAELGAATPTLVVVEDVHWADHSSRDLLTLLLTRGFPSEVSLLVTYRSDDLHRRHPLHDTLAVWTRIADVDHPELAPLAERDIRRLVATVSASELDEEATADIVRRAEGNPFFAEELASSAVSGRAATGGLARVLQARIEQLDETALQVVRALAVAERDVSHVMLAEVVDLTESELDAAVSAAVEHHVVETCWPPAYRLRHALLGEVVLDQLLPGERLRLHRRYAAVLSEHPRLAPASELARHALASGDRRTAVAASREAAEQAMAVGGPQDALAHLERALDLLSENDPSRDEVTLRASDAAIAAGDPLLAVRLVADRLSHPGVQEDPLHRAELLAAYATRARILDLPVDGLALTQEALALVPPTQERGHLAVLVAHLQQLVDTGDWRAATAVGDHAVALAERLGSATALTEIRAVLTQVVEALDDIDAAESHLRAVWDDVADRDDPTRLRLAHQLASFRHRRGDLPGALEWYETGALLADQSHRTWAPWGLECRLQAGMTAAELGDWEHATRRLSLGDIRIPQPGRSLFDAARLSLAVARGERPSPAEIWPLREWWPVDGLLVVLTTGAGIELLGNLGDVFAAVDLAEAGVASLDRMWGAAYQSIVRIAALTVGQLGTATERLDPVSRAALLTRVETLAARAEQVGAAAAEPDESGGLGVETWAWTQRLRAERLRLTWRVGTLDGPQPGEVVRAWEQSVAAFERYGHAFEAARSRARLAHAQRAAGDGPGARASAAAAREVAARLGALPLIAELDALVPAGTDLGGGEALTGREAQVLDLVARGLTNGQIGLRLHISTKTVSVHVSRVLAKLGAAGRTEAAAIAHARGLLE